MSASKIAHAPGRPEQRIAVGITPGRLYTPALCGELNIRAKRAAKPDLVTCPECLRLLDAERDEVTIHAPGCEYDNCTGCVVMPDEEGGYEVQLPGVDHLVHFERSELEFAAGAR